MHSWTTVLAVVALVATTATAIPTARTHRHLGLRGESATQRSNALLTATAGVGSGVGSGAAVGSDCGDLRAAVGIRVAVLKAALLSPQRDQPLLAAFRQGLEEHAKKEFNSENVDFLGSDVVGIFAWLTHYDAWNKGSDVEKNKLRNLWLKIYKKFVPDGAPKQINIGPDDREALVAVYGEMTKKTGRLAYPPKNVFDDAIKEVLNLVARDAYPRFVGTTPVTPALCTQVNAAVPLI